MESALGLPIGYEAHVFFTRLCCSRHRQKKETAATKAITEVCKPPGTYLA